MDQDNQLTLTRFLGKHQEMQQHETPELLVMEKKKGNRKNAGRRDEHDDVGDRYRGRKTSTFADGVEVMEPYELKRDVEVIC